jgi:ankyrin repeat protein
MKPLSLKTLEYWQDHAQNLIQEISAKDQVKSQYFPASQRINNAQQTRRDFVKRAQDLNTPGVPPDRVWWLKVKEMTEKIQEQRELHSFKKQKGFFKRKPTLYGLLNDLLVQKNIDQIFMPGSSGLHHATDLNDKALVDKLLLLGASVDKLEHSKTALHLAASKGHAEIVAALLNAGAYIDAVDAQKKTALHLASSEGHTEIVAALINADANIDAFDAQKKTALHLASSQGHAEIVAALLKAGAHIHALDPQKNTPLHLASSQGHAEIVAALLKAGANIHHVNILQDTALHFAAKAGHTNVMSLLLNRSSDDKDKQNSKLETPLYLAVENRHKAVAQMLIKNQADINLSDSNRWTPLLMSTHKDYAEITRLLIDSGADVNPIALTSPLMQTVHKLQANKHASMTTLLTLARLLSAGADVHFKNIHLETPLSILMRQNEPKYIIFFVYHALMVNKKNLDKTVILTEKQLSQLSKNAQEDHYSENQKALLAWIIGKHFGFKGVRIEADLIKKIELDDLKAIMIFEKSPFAALNKAGDQYDAGNRDEFALSKALPAELMPKIETYLQDPLLHEFKEKIEKEKGEKVIQRAGSLASSRSGDGPAAAASAGGAGIDESEGTGSRPRK